MEVLGEKDRIDGDTPVDMAGGTQWVDMELVESYCLRVQYKGGGIFHGRLNRGEKPIANKYCEGKLARTLEKELEEPEVVVLEAIDCRTTWCLLFVYGLVRV